MKKVFLGVLLGVISVTLFFVFIIYGIVFLDELSIKKAEGVKSSDPCYKKYYPGKGIIYEVKEDRVCMEFYRGIDKAYVKTLEDANPKTFHELGDNYFADKEDVFYEARKLIDVTPDNFSLLDSCYAKGGGKIFYCGEEFAADYDTFEIVSEKLMDYARDKNYVYYTSKSIDVSDPLSFKFIGSSYFIDKYNVYHKSLEFKKLRDANPQTFQVFKNTEYAKDEKYVYYYGKKISGADAKTFEILTNVFAVDQFYVYFSENKLEDLDVDSFQQIGSSDYLRDLDTLYYRDRKIENVDVKNFHLVGYRKQKSEKVRFVSDSITCGTDGNVVLCHGDVIDGGEIIDIGEVENK